VPDGRAVRDVEDAWEAAEEVGLPVVVKPTDGNHGRGVFIDLSTREQVIEAYPLALKQGSEVMIERFIPGVDHRLLVVGSEMVAANRGEPACIVGDGKRYVRDLIETQLNSDPRRGTHDTTPWSIIDTVKDIDSTMLLDLQKQGHDLTTIPRQGERVLVWRFANPSVDVTDDVHPSIREHVVVAAKTAGLDICGIDVVCRDVSRPLEEQGGAIVEINASPGLNIHLKPAMGKGRPVGEAIIKMLFPNGQDGRIPVIGITGSHGKTMTTKLLAHLLKPLGKFLGVCHSEGLQFGDRHAPSKQGDRLFGTQGVLLHPWTEIAICETSAESIILEGVGYDRCQIGVVLNVGTEHLGLGYIDTLEQMTKVKRCVVDVVLPTGTAVLNADDVHVAAMASYCKGSVLFFSRDATNTLINSHREAGGRAVFLQDESIHLTDGKGLRFLCALSEVSLPMSGHLSFHLENVLAAVGAAWAMGLNDEALVNGLRSLHENHRTQ
jgi:cyanophycin synthetase